MKAILETWRARWWLLVPLMLLTGWLVWRGLLWVVWLGGTGGLVWLARRAHAPRVTFALFALSTLPLVALLVWDIYTRLTGGYAYAGGHAPIGKSLAAVAYGVLAFGAQMGLLVAGLVAWGISRMRKG